MLADVKQQASLPHNVNAHDVHHYTMLYVLMIGVILVIVVLLRIRERVRNLVKRPEPAPRHIYFLNGNGSEEVTDQNNRIISMPNVALNRSGEC